MKAMIGDKEKGDKIMKKINYIMMMHSWSTYASTIFYQFLFILSFLHFYLSSFNANTIYEAFKEFEKIIMVITLTRFLSLIWKKTSVISIFSELKNVIQKLNH